MYSLSKERLGHTEASACPSLRFDVEKSFLDAVHARGRSVAEPRSVPALDNTLIEFRVSEKADENRRARYKLRETSWKISSLERVRKCGKVPVRPFVSLRGGKGIRSGFGGLAVCGSIHSCVCCASAIQKRRTREIERLIEHCKEQGLYVSLLTLTVRHSKNDPLTELYTAISDGWRSVISGQKWLDWKSQIGLKHFVRSIECTISTETKFHLHQHVLICSEKDPAKTPFVYQRKQGRAKHPYPPEIMSSYDFIADRWERGIGKTGKTFLRDKGMDWTTAENALAMGRYVSKMQGQGNLAAEMALGGFKKGRASHSRTPFQVLADIALYDDPADKALYWEWEQGSYRRRAMTWSRGTKEELGLLDLTDEEIAEAETEKGEVVLEFDHENWKKVRKAGAVYLLEVLERHGVYSAQRWCDAHKIVWHYPEIYEPPWWERLE